MAETYDDNAMIDVLVEEAKEEYQLKNYSRFESLLLRAHKPELIIAAYKVRCRLTQICNSCAFIHDEIFGLRKTVCSSKR